MTGTLTAAAAIRALTAEELDAKVREHAGDERRSLVEFLLHLAEIDRRRDYERFGKDSLWGYVHEHLGYPECQTFARTTSVRLLRRHPEIVGYLLDGRVSMTALVELRKVLDASNVVALLDRASGKSKKAVREMVAALAAPVVPVAEIRPLTAPRVVEVPADTLALRSDAREVQRQMEAAVSPASAEGADATAPPVAAGRAVLVVGPQEARSIRPVSARQKELVITIDEEFERDLMELGELLDHSFQKNDYAALLGYSMKKALVALRKRRNGTGEPLAAGRADEEHTSRDREAPAAGRDAHEAGVGRTSGASREREAPAAASEADEETIAAMVLTKVAARIGRVHVPLNLQRDVWRRARFCCEWKLKNGRKCGSRRRCQIDHIVPVARGGGTEAGNLRILCQAHNLEAARRVFGNAYIDACIAKSRRRTNAEADAKPGKPASDEAPERPPG